VFVALAFSAAYYTFLLELKRRQVVDHPKRLMDKMLIVCGIMGLIGAAFFSSLEQPQLFAYNGLNYYGALIVGSTTYFIIAARHGIRFATAADIGSPGMMLAYGIGRLGCHLSGDGDWGVVVRHAKPSWLPSFLWSSTYPHNVLHEGVAIPGCTDVYDYCTQLPAPVYPTSLYEALVCILLFLLLWGLRRRLTTPGALFGLFALLNGVERLSIEYIRINPRYSFLGLSLSQAQIIALGWVVVGFVVTIGIFVYRFSKFRR
jgi:phosphatidylglycerol:prolipoprotein diacylglycerol transferase